MGEYAFAAVRFATFSADAEGSLAAAAQADIRTQTNVALFHAQPLNGQNATYPFVLMLFYV